MKRDDLGNGTEKGQATLARERTQDQPMPPVTSMRAGGVAFPALDASQPLAVEDDQLEPDQFVVLILPSGRTQYEFGSEAVAARFFGSRQIVANKEELRAVITELIADPSMGASPGIRKARKEPVDRNLVTTREFAAVLDCAESSVFEMLKLGLPSIKSPKLGRRILKAEALAWIQGGGATRSRTAKRLRNAGAERGG